jgi:hypothetical protein
MKRFNAARHAFGKLGEAELLPLIETLLDEKLTCTEKLYDTMDAENENYLIEIKTRTARYHWDDSFIKKDGWLLPQAKIERAAKEKRKVLFYYYWKKDNSLFVLEYAPEVFADLTPRVPSFHADKQMHYFIPGNRWKPIRKEPQASSL